MIYPAAISHLARKLVRAPARNEVQPVSYAASDQRGRRKSGHIRAA
jgi:hypothetical protein